MFGPTFHDIALRHYGTPPHPRRRRRITSARPTAKRKSRWDADGDDKPTVGSAPARSGGQAAIKAHLASIAAKLQGGPADGTYGIGAADGGPTPAESDDPEVVKQYAKYVDITDRVRSGYFADERPEHARSPSPPPQYDKYGVRTNTRELRIKAKLEDERSELIGWLVARCPHMFRPPQDWKPKKRTRKLYVPLKEYPGYNFIGIIIGPRGNTQKRMQRETNTRIAIRGKGSVKDGVSREPGADYQEDEDLHVLITGDTEEEVDRAAAMVQTLLKPVDDDYNEHKRAQLRELALINGTLRNPGARAPPRLAGGAVDKTGAGYRAPAEPDARRRRRRASRRIALSRTTRRRGGCAQAAHLRVQRFSASWASATGGLGLDQASARAAGGSGRDRNEINPCKLFVGRWRITSPTNARQALERFGRCARPCGTRTTSARGFGFVEFASENRAAAAKVAHRPLEGKTIVVKVAGDRSGDPDGPPHEEWTAGMGGPMGAPRPEAAGDGRFGMQPPGRRGWALRDAAAGSAGDGRYGMQPPGLPGMGGPLPAAAARGRAPPPPPPAYGDAPPPPAAARLRGRAAPAAPRPPTGTCPRRRRPPGAVDPYYQQQQMEVRSDGRVRGVPGAGRRRRGWEAFRRLRRWALSRLRRPPPVDPTEEAYKNFMADMEYDIIIASFQVDYVSSG